MKNDRTIDYRIHLLKAVKIEMVLGPLVTHKDSTGLLQEIVNNEEAEFYCRPDNPLVESTNPDPKDLDAAKWILGERDTTLRKDRRALRKI